MYDQLRGVFDLVSKEASKELRNQADDGYC